MRLQRGASTVAGVTHYQDLHQVLDEREGQRVVLVVTGSLRTSVAPQLRTCGWVAEVVTLEKDYHSQVGAFDVEAALASTQVEDDDLFVLVKSLNDPALSSMLALPWPVTVVETGKDPWRPIERVADWYRGHRFEVLTRDGARLVRQHPHAQALTRTDLGGRTAKSTTHSFSGPWEELRAHSFGSEALVGVEVLAPHWGELSTAVLETAGRLRADDEYASSSAVVLAAQALEE